VIYSTTCAYGIHAVCRIAVMAPDGYARIQEICRNSDLPPLFVTKILRDLVRAGILRSAKGRHGGFGLARPADKLRLLDIVEVIDGVQSHRQCIVGLARCDDRQPCPQHDSFKPIRHRIISYLTETTVRQMADALLAKSAMVGRPIPLSRPDSPSPRPGGRRQRPKPAPARLRP
jgi:Rrf2 family protein